MNIKHTISSIIFKETVFRLMNSGSISGSHLDEDRAVVVLTGGLDNFSSMMIEAEASELSAVNFRRFI